MPEREPMCAIEMSPIEHEGDIVSRCVSPDSSPRYEVIWSGVARVTYCAQVSAEVAQKIRSGDISASEACAGIIPEIEGKISGLAVNPIRVSLVDVNHA